ncbi:peptidylprolyl isomerase [Methyloglobulus sp.]|uniref:peptidylprolyl isomerase n=1 Tax=Methyloglobulus sp. TaxID=2518622 RepID=UPI00398A2DEA
MNRKLIPLLIAAVIISACDPKATTGASSAPAVKKEDAIASVNGQYISKKTLEDLEKDIAQRSQGQTPAFPKEKLVDELVQREILVQDAVQKKLDQAPETVAQLEAARKAILTQASLQNYLKANPITDAEIKKEYDSKVGGGNGTEYKASHILVKTEDEAKKLIAELDKGGKFAKLANKHSLDAKESKNGGDLGWFNPSQMVAPFSEAVAKLEKSKYSKEPVKTQFGYHIIRLEDSRKQTPPPLEAVKEQLTPTLQRQKIQAMVENLRKQAKVEILLPKEEPKPATLAPAPASAPAESSAPEPAATATPATAEPAKEAEKPAEPAKK